MRLSSISFSVWGSSCFSTIYWTVIFSPSLNLYSATPVVYQFLTCVQALCYIGMSLATVLYSCNYSNIRINVDMGGFPLLLLFKRIFGHSWSLTLSLEFQGQLVKFCGKFVLDIDWNHIKFEDIANGDRNEDIHYNIIWNWEKLATVRLVNCGLVMQ